MASDSTPLARVVRHNSDFYPLSPELCDQLKFEAQKGIVKLIIDVDGDAEAGLGKIYTFTVTSKHDTLIFEYINPSGHFEPKAAWYAKQLTDVYQVSNTARVSPDVITLYWVRSQVLPLSLEDVARLRELAKPLFEKKDTSLSVEISICICTQAEVEKTSIEPIAFLVRLADKSGLLKFEAIGGESEHIAYANSLTDVYKNAVKGKCISKKLSFDLLMMRKEALLPENSLQLSQRKLQGCKVRKKNDLTSDEFALIKRSVSVLSNRASLVASDYYLLLKGLVNPSTPAHALPDETSNNSRDSGSSRETPSLPQDGHESGETRCSPNTNLEKEHEKNKPVLPTQPSETTAQDSQDEQADLSIAATEKIAKLLTAEDNQQGDSAGKGDSDKKPTIASIKKQPKAERTKKKKKKTRSATASRSPISPPKSHSTSPEASRSSSPWTWGPFANSPVPSSSPVPLSELGQQHDGNKVKNSIDKVRSKSTEPQRTLLPQEEINRPQSAPVLLEVDSNKPTKSEVQVCVSQMPVKVIDVTSDGHISMLLPDEIKKQNHIPPEAKPEQTKGNKKFQLPPAATVIKAKHKAGKISVNDNAVEQERASGHKARVNVFDPDAELSDDKQLTTAPSSVTRNLSQTTASTSITVERRKEKEQLTMLSVSDLDTLYKDLYIENPNVGGIERLWVMLSKDVILTPTHSIFGDTEIVLVQGAEEFIANVRKHGDEVIIVATDPNENKIENIREGIRALLTSKGIEKGNSGFNRLDVYQATKDLEESQAEDADADKVAKIVLEHLNEKRENSPENNGEDAKRNSFQICIVGESYTMVAKCLSMKQFENYDSLGVEVTQTARLQWRHQQHLLGDKFDGSEQKRKLRNKITRHTSLSTTYKRPYLTEVPMSRLLSGVSFTEGPVID
ncbi:hypothetical protein D5018_06635 [Parashewanella curva]|uniref:Uncharacterized protein n=1 Tax=Parashewanella curva TaxID=2338552 RepID=A0A3L8PYV4_9GAMM|nr:hypothetical protein [Parashewanella curva]RLV60465.1 hypothetical protein D5018_06635 [Parashewanella curva]